MEAEECGDDIGKLESSHSSGGNNFNKAIPNFEEIIQDIDEAINNDHVVSNLKSDSPIIPQARDDISLILGCIVDPPRIVSQLTP